jgi:hypothetical protein
MRDERLRKHSNSSLLSRIKEIFDSLLTLLWCFVGHDIVLSREATKHVCKEIVISSDVKVCRSVQCSSVVGVCDHLLM